MPICGRLGYLAVGTGHSPINPSAGGSRSASSRPRTRPDWTNTTCGPTEPGTPTHLVEACPRLARRIDSRSKTWGIWIVDQGKIACIRVPEIRRLHVTRSCDMPTPTSTTDPAHAGVDAQSRSNPSAITRKINSPVSRHREWPTERLTSTRTISGVTLTPGAESIHRPPERRRSEPLARGELGPTTAIRPRGDRSGYSTTAPS